MGWIRNTYLVLCDFYCIFVPCLIGRWDEYAYSCKGLFQDIQDF